MAIENEFMDAVQARDVLLIRIMLKDSLLVDPTAAQFDELERYATQRVENIYDEHDGEKLNFDVSFWNEEYLNQQMVIVVNNFSKDRIELLKSMVRYLYRDKADRIRNERVVVDTSNNISRKQVGAGVSAVGAALTVAGLCTSHTALAVGGLCTSHTALAVGGVVVVVAGVTLIISDKGNE